MVNIFVSHPNPKKAVRHQPDLLLPRMALEAAQVLCAVHYNWREEDPLHAETYERVPKFFDELEPPPYKASLGGRKHPIVLWATSDKRHYQWALIWAKELVREYERRRPDANTLKCKRAIRWANINRPDQPSKYSSGNPHHLYYYAAINYDELRDFPSTGVVDLYRLSLVHKWGWEYSRNHIWSKCKPPEWAMHKDYVQFCTKLWGKPHTPTWSYIKKALS